MLVTVSCAHKLKNQARKNGLQAGGVNCMAIPAPNQPSGESKHCFAGCSASENK